MEKGRESNERNRERRDNLHSRIRADVRAKMQRAESVNVQDIPQSNRKRLYKANARSAALDTKITGTESAGVRGEKIAKIRATALAQACAENRRITNEDSAIVYQILQRMYTMRKRGEGIAVSLEFFEDLESVKAELRYAFLHRFKSGSYDMRIHYDERKLKIWRNF